MSILSIKHFSSSRSATAKSEPELTIDDVTDYAMKLSSRDKIRLIERLSANLAVEIDELDKRSRRSLDSLWSDVDIAEDDITETRAQMSRSFPREDL